MVYVLAIALTNSTASGGLASRLIPASPVLLGLRTRVKVVVLFPVVSLCHVFLLIGFFFFWLVKRFIFPPDPTHYHRLRNLLLDRGLAGSSK